jgi:hypothetical protein
VHKDRYLRIVTSSDAAKAGRFLDLDLLFQSTNTHRLKQPSARLQFTATAEPEATDIPAPEAEITGLVISDGAYAVATK